MLPIAAVYVAEEWVSQFKCCNKKKKNWSRDKDKNADEDDDDGDDDGTVFAQFEKEMVHWQSNFRCCIKRNEKTIS